MLLSLNVAKSAGQVYQPVVIPLQDLKIECYCFSAAGCCVIFLFNSNEYLKLIWWVPLAGLSASSPYLLISPRLITILHDPALQADHCQKCHQNLFYSADFDFDGLYQVVVLVGGVNLSTFSNVLCLAQTSRRHFPDTINFRFMSTLARQNISQASLSDQAAPLPLIPASQILSNKYRS